MRLMHELQGETVLTVKGNQPTLYDDLATYFADPQARYLQAETVDRRRGRVEVRTIKGSHEMNAYLAPSWPFVAQVAQLTRTVTKAGKTTTEVVYLITTLSSSKASPERLLELNRGHWGIENRSHYVRDVSFGEDRSRLRTGNAPQILAALRNLAITLIHRFGSSHIKATRLHFASCPQEALALLSQKRAGQQSFTDPERRGMPLDRYRDSWRNLERELRQRNKDRGFDREPAYLPRYAIVLEPELYPGENLYPVGEKTIALFNKVQEIIHPDINFERMLQVARKKFPEAEFAPAWRRAYMDIHICLNHIISNADYLLSKDEDIYGKAKELERCGARRVLSFSVDDQKILIDAINNSAPKARGKRGNKSSEKNSPKNKGK